MRSVASSDPLPDTRPRINSYGSWPSSQVSIWTSVPAGEAAARGRSSCGTRSTGSFWRAGRCNRAPSGRLSYDRLHAGIRDHAPIDGFVCGAR